ncbi:MAG: helix-turn-helix domain-containing protein [Rhodothermales bacterium]
MKPIPSFRAAHLKPYTDFLFEIGAPVEAALRRAKLPVMLHEQPDAYLPQFPTLTFLRDMSRNEGIEEFGVRVLQGLRVRDFSTAFATAVYRLPTLKATLEKFRDLVHLEDNQLNFWITARGTIARLHIASSCPLDPVGMQYEDWNQIMAMIAIVREFAGQAWEPEEIGFRSNIHAGSIASEQFPATRFFNNQHSAWITVPSEFLSSPPKKPKIPMDAGHTPDLETATHAESTMEFPTSLKRVLIPYLGDGYPQIQLAAELAGLSVRTLQRRLRQYNTNYSELIQHARFDVASRLLQNTDEKIIDIAYELGYEDPAHFTRAFGQLSGVSPSQYRRHHCRQ